MREQIEILATLQEVDRGIKEKSGARGALLAELQKKQEEIQARNSEMTALRGEWEGKEKARREKELQLQDENKKAIDKRMRMTRIKNIKELQALQREIDQIKQGNSQLEEELIKLMEELEVSAASVRAKEEELKQLEDAWKEKRGGIEAEVAGIDKAVADASAVRQSIAARLNRELIGRYELIFSRRGGTAVVSVAEGICQGCFMNIPPQLWNEIIRSDKLILCPSCHRILYHKPAVPSDKHL